LLQVLLNRRNQQQFGIAADSGSGWKGMQLRQRELLPNPLSFSCDYSRALRTDSSGSASESTLMDTSMADVPSSIEAKIQPLPASGMEWLAVFGPGAIVASLTIGTGELIFSTRGGALFGYNVLFLFVAISVLKWGLVVTTSRHMVLTGVHPYQRMLELPGPRGWMPLMLLLMSIVCVPIWIAFHAGVIGNLTSWITGTRDVLGGGMDYVWGILILLGVLTLVFVGGYSMLERVQMFIVGALMLSALVTLLLYNPDWMAMLTGVVPKPLTYPSWLADKYPQIADHSVWVEATRYVGVIGGGAFDYLAWTSWVRQKKWGALPSQPNERELQAIADDVEHPVRKWLRAPVVDSTISFALIVGFSAVFVASGSLILGPREVVPDENNLLNLQAEFVTHIHDWLLPLYVSGAFLAMIGTLYGTTEIAVVVADEIVRSFVSGWNSKDALRLKRAVVIWSGVVALSVLGWLLVRQMSVAPRPNGDVLASVAAVEDSSMSSGAKATESIRVAKPRLLLALLTPVSLVTGVLACGLICGLNLWMDRRFLPKPLRMSLLLLVLNSLAAVVFFGIGAKGWWDGHRAGETFIETRWFPLTGLFGMVCLSFIAAGWLNRSRNTE